MTAYVAANWPVFLMAAGGLVLLISATGFARWWHQDGQHAAPADEDRQTIAWLARIRPRPLADARIRVAALTAAIGTAGRPDGVPWADADQFLPAWPAASISDIETPLSFAREVYPQTLPPLPDLHPGWPGHADEARARCLSCDADRQDIGIGETCTCDPGSNPYRLEVNERGWPTGNVLPDDSPIVKFDGELTAAQLDELRQAFEAACSRPVMWLGDGDPPADVPGPAETVTSGGSGDGPVLSMPDSPTSVSPAGPGTHARTEWLSQPADPAQAGHLQPLWADDTGSFAAICAGDAW
jgi:hypothetical protein